MNLSKVLKEQSLEKDEKMIQTFRLIEQLPCEIDLYFYNTL